MTWQKNLNLQGYQILNHECANHLFAALIICVSFVTMRLESSQWCEMLLQVSFVFTNQVDGKLVPVDSTIKPTTGEENHKNQHNAKGHMLGKFTSSSRNQIVFPSMSSRDVSMSALTPPFKPLQRPQTKLTGSSQGITHLGMKPGLSLRNQLPQKRFSPDNVDDDFA